MSDDEYPKYKVLHYFETRDLILDNGLRTGIFDESLLSYVDAFCVIFNSGAWRYHQFQGGINFYYEFMQYLKSIGVDVKFKS